jgi:hypothetical protein
MTLKEKLDAMRAASRARIPAETQAVMQRSTESLRASGIMDRVVKPGQPAPAFMLPDEHGRPVSLDQLCARGPVVLSFYRGRW